MSEKPVIKSDSISSYLLPSFIFDLSGRLIDQATQDPQRAIEYLDEVKTIQSTTPDKKDLIVKATRLFNIMANPKPAEIIPINSVKSKKPKTIKRSPKYLG